MLTGQIQVITEFGEIVFDGISFNDPSTPRWCAYQNTVLWTDEVYKGENRGTPTAPGRRGREHLEEEQRYLIPLAVTGCVDASGVYLGLLGADARCLDVIQHLKKTLSPKATDPYTHTMTFYAPNEEVWTSDCTMLGLRKRSYGSGVWDGDIECKRIRPWVIA